MEQLSRGQGQKSKQPRQKWRHNTQLIFLCCFFAAVLGYYLWLPGGAVHSGSVPERYQQRIISPETSRPVMPARYSLHAMVRDPFVIPKEFQPVTVDPVTLPVVKEYSNTQQTVLPPVTPEIQLKLVGVVSGGGHQVAIIKTGGVSRSYQIEDYIGLYRLVFVGESSATLWGPQGKKVLALER